MGSNNPVDYITSITWTL